MSAEILLIAVLTSSVQAVFGAGVLLIGTPILLLLGYAFVDVLAVLLPISLTINLLKISKYHAHIDVVLFRRVIVLALPPIALFLFLVTHVRINTGLVIGPFLVFIACKSLSPMIEKWLDKMMGLEKLYLLAVGIVHGTSNLGGSLLTALIHHKNYPKDVARVTVAACYGAFAVVQITTLALFSRDQISTPIFGNLIYMLAGTVVYELMDATVFGKIEQDRYRHIFAGFLAFAGLVLIAKSFLQ